MQTERGAAKVGMRTPWGKADSVRQKARGIWEVSTPGHGGFKVRAKENTYVPEPFRKSGGWYEEDIDWAIVVAFFHGSSNWAVNVPRECHIYESGDTCNRAIATLKDWYPDEYEKVFSVKVSPEESHVLRERAFKEATKDKWVTVSAAGDWHENVPQGMVGVSAKKGGDLTTREYRYFLVPAEDYSSRKGAYVVPDDAEEVFPTGNRAPF